MCASVMKFGSFDGGGDREHNGVSLMVIPVSEIFVM